MYVSTTLPFAALWHLAFALWAFSLFGMRASPLVAGVFVRGVASALDSFKVMTLCCRRPRVRASAARASSLDASRRRHLLHPPGGRQCHGLHVRVAGRVQYRRALAAPQSPGLANCNAPLAPFWPARLPQALMAHASSYTPQLISQRMTQANAAHLLIFFIACAIVLFLFFTLSAWIMVRAKEAPCRGHGMPTCARALCMMDA